MPKQSTSYKDQVKRALEQADLKDVNVGEEESKNTVTLIGTLHSEDAKSHAADVAQAKCRSQDRGNEISIEPAGNESAARSAESN